MAGVLLVTGGSRGIGAAICRAGAELGFAVAVNFRTTERQAEEVAGAIVAAGGRAVTIQADITREREVVAMFERLDRTLGRATALVNNAGGGVGSGPVEDTTAEQIAAAISLNLTAPILCSREAVRRMSKARGGGGGGIVNVSSMSAFNGGMGGLANYAAAKGGLESFTVALANEVGGNGIRVNCIRLGAIETEVHINDAPEWREAMTKSIVLRRYGEPEEAAQAAMFLLSDKASYVTGAILNVSGGRR
jgi:NAD(P)-dependent dehydrogenase (short-subunit alcohol dehydrogenase family)